MSIEGKNRELLFQELYNMVGYHLAKYDRMPSLLFDDKNPKSSDPTKHVEYDENEGKIVIHTGRFKMKREDILEKLRGFQCEIGIDGQAESVKFDFTKTSQGNNSIAVGALEGFLTCGGRLQVSEERQEKYYTEKKTILKDRNQEDGNEQLGDLFNKGPNKGSEGNNNSVQNITNQYGGPSVPQQTGPQPNGGQQPEKDTWLTDDIPYNVAAQEEGIGRLLGLDPNPNAANEANRVLDALTNEPKKWEKRSLKPGTLRQAAQQGDQASRHVRNNYFNNPNFNMMNNNIMGQVMMNPNNNWMNQNGMNQNRGVMNNNMNNPPYNAFNNNNFQNNANNPNMLANPNTMFPTGNGAQFNQYQQPYNGNQNNANGAQYPGNNNQYGGNNPMGGGFFQQQNYGQGYPQNNNANLNGNMGQGQYQGGVMANNNGQFYTGQQNFGFQGGGW